MCKDCENKTELNKEEQYQEFDIENMDNEQLKQIIYQLLDVQSKMIKVDNSELNGIKIDENNFKQGIRDASYTIGFYSCLVNGGMDEDNAYELTLNNETGRINYKQSKINFKTEKLNNEKSSI